MTTVTISWFSSALSWWTRQSYSATASRSVPSLQNQILLLIFINFQLLKQLSLSTAYALVLLIISYMITITSLTVKKEDCMNARIQTNSQPNLVATLHNIPQFRAKLPIIANYLG
ncbi:Hypothetical_protein [Hexamita inflata]|uniref:Hypothetical_protein n=1 Tax=Hexamita inflata TaxID=28002 RepID=A0ABP1H8Q3_9EUKA